MAETRQSTRSYQPAATVTPPTNRSSSDTGARGNRDVYSTYRPATTSAPVTRPANATFSTRGSDTTRQTYTAYSPAATTSARKPDITNNSSASDRGNGRGNSGYYLRPTTDQPSVDPAPTTRPVRDAKLATGRSDSNVSAGYKPGSSGSTGNRPNSNTDRPSVDAAPTTRSIRDAKLAEARQSSRNASPAYGPATRTASNYHPADMRANAPRAWTTYKPTRYIAPKSYTPPSYRSGHYYYSTPRYSRPCSFGYWAFDYYPSYSHRSLYFHFGLFPYIEITHIFVRDYPTVVYVDRPIYSIYDTSYDSYEITRYPGLDDALADIRAAWIGGRTDLIERHVRDSYDIAVLLDGKYDYSVSSGDYLAMTRDALGDMDTVSFVWDKVQRRSNGTITALGAHTYRSSDASHTIYVSYTLQKIGGGYYITEVGSTQAPWN